MVCPGGRRSPSSRPARWLVLLLIALAACSSTKSASRAGPGPSVEDSSTTTLASTSTSTTPSASAATVLSGPQGGPVPANFAAVSVTFVSLQTGWVLGTALCGSPPCTSLVRTRDGGKSWAGVPAPRADLSVDQSPGVSRIRFADADNGWAFGPDLWMTHDGGSHWSAVSLPGPDKGSKVWDLAAANGVVHAVVFGANGVRILSSPVAADAWRASPTTVPVGAGPVPRAQLVVQGTTGWVVEVDRTVIGGARLSGGAWAPWQPPCLDAGGPMVLAASTPSDLVAVCDEGVWTGDTPVTRAYVSSDGGTTFRPTKTPVPLSTSTNAAASAAARTAVVAAGGSAVIVGTFDGGATWSTVERGAPSDWTDLGFTNPSQGAAVEIPFDARAGSLLMTVDGGHTWSAVAFR